ncbi:src-like-adapter 2 [Ammospiza nelsoni]|uniref:src-like-adapter 2 n=1 Tax=Ammospiza nelsoni TaxID=2857394 RepID=UPI002869E69D|nr:src-like-adapter 2 [Ammospiza nelsoni]
MLMFCSISGCYFLSVQCGKCSAWASVTHCHIHRLDNGWLYISSWLTFPSLHNLVDHYSEFSEGLCCSVCDPCPMEGPRAAPAPTALSVLRKPSLHWNKTESSLLFLETTSPPDGSPISSYLILSETDTPEPDPTGKVVIDDQSLLFVLGPIDRNVDSQDQCRARQAAMLEGGSCLRASLGPSWSEQAASDNSLQANS